ncbi:MAG: RNA methyltransferase [Candidatus Nanohaloarchaea archaeon]|nr:RNA methyltransferase [Candidatus Nanohaloarchaea archaeon]
MFTCIVVEPEIEGNLGFLARTMANFEVEQLILVDPDAPVGEEARNRAVKAQDILDDARIEDTLDDALDHVDVAVGTTARDAESSNVLRNAVSPEEMAERANKVDGDIGIVLGRESKGLSNEELDLCDFAVTIPTSDDYPVMNITHAAAVMFYECFKHRNNDTQGEASSRGEKETLNNIFKNMLTTLDYSDAERERILRCMKNFVGRSFLHKQEAHTLIGFFKNVENKLQGDN